jgi:prolyl 4-hydroxylase
MKRINFKKDLILRKKPNFIGSWNIENDNLCKEIINFFEDNKSLQMQGFSAAGKNLAIKKTTDITINPNDIKNLKFKIFEKYIGELYNCFTDYKNQWPFLKETINMVDIGAFNIQKYFPGDHFAKIHTERSNLTNLHRVFAWMTYLNDVEDGGQTNFTHYNIKIKPEIGKTLIWPAEWTHAHSGEILNSGTKYIITGWMNFPYDGEKVR